jgi:hypothetical protein
VYTTLCFSTVRVFPAVEIDRPTRGIACAASAWRRDKDVIERIINQDEFQNVSRDRRPFEYRET